MPASKPPIEPAVLVEALVNWPPPPTATPNVPPALTATVPVAGIAVGTVNSRTPALIVVPLSYEFAPESVCMPVPVLMSDEPVPLRICE